MAEIHLAASKQASQQQRFVSIYWDYQNIPQVEQATNLLLFATIRAALINRNVYNNWEQSSKNKEHLQSLNFNCVDVSIPIKNAVDFQLSIDCGCDNSHIIILVLGDCYGEILIRSLKQKDKKVIVFARKGSVAPALEKLADEFYFTDELAGLLENKIQPRTGKGQCQIAYNEAIEYLIEAIKTALSKGKKATLGFINQQMAKLFPEYEAVSSICPPNGRKKFSKFIDFAKAVEEDGLVQIKDDNLFLIE
jgi:NYN domain